MNSKSTTVDVLVKLPHGICLGTIMPSVNGMAFDSSVEGRVFLKHGYNPDVSRAAVERWIAGNKNLAAVKRGDVRILETDKLAVDSATTNRK